MSDADYPFSIEDTPIIELFSKVTDPRVIGRCQHNLIDILIITVCSYLCGIYEWEEIEFFATERQAWFERFLELPNGIPSHDTFLRIFKIIDAKEFEIAFIEWIQTVVELKKNQVIAFDGKMVNGTYRGHCSKRGRALTLLNVWATEDEVSLGQLKASSSGCAELESIKEILNYINIKDMIVTVDSASSTAKFAQVVREKKADYLFPVKKNQGNFAFTLETIFKEQTDKFDVGVLEGKQKGRFEKRSSYLLQDKKIIQEIASYWRWPDLKTVALMTYERSERDKRNVKQESLGEGGWKWVKVEEGEKTSFEVRFIISSREFEPVELIETVKKHWHIENKLHWVLDVHFEEDKNKTRNKIAAENMSLLRKLALNLIKQEKSLKKSNSIKMTKCLLNQEYLEKVLFS